MKKVLSLFLALSLLFSLSITAFSDETDHTIFSYRKDQFMISQENKTIDVKNIMQYPELPTGCESVALTILLNHLGYPADKLDIVRNYLPKMDFYWKNGLLYGADFRTTFAGNPESIYAYGCYAPCIVTAANKYLNTKGYNAEAIDITGTSFDDLLKEYIDKDMPVLIWITSDNLIEPYYTDTWYTPGGYTVQWLANEHCVVLTGYDSDRGLVYVADPLVGNTSYNYDRIKQRYIQLGQQSVYIKDLTKDSDSDSSEADNMDTDDSDTKHTDITDTDTEDKGSDTDSSDSDVAEYNIIGDANGDGKVTAKDSIIIQRYVISMTKLDDSQLAVSDVNYDGKVTNKDSLSVLRYTISLGDGMNIGKESKYSIVGDWTRGSQKQYTNMSFNEDGTLLMKVSSIPWVLRAKWSITNNILTVDFYGNEEVYYYKSNTLVLSTDNSIVCVRGTTEDETETPDPDENDKQTPDQPKTSDSGEKDRQTPDEADKIDTPSEPMKSKQIEFVNILQNPDLPTGAECVSLTMLLNHFGFPADKLEIVRKYLPKQEFYYVDGELYGADFRTTFAGNPEDESSYGCYAPCIVITANNYFADKDYNAKAYDLTSTEFEALLTDYINNDIPLIVWITNNGLEPSSLSTVWKTPDGETVQWRRPEHCVVLTGYDIEKKIVYVSDPLFGNTEYDFDTFAARFNEMGKQAVLIR